MIDKLLKFKKLKPKERALIIGLLIVVAVSAYFNVIYRPLTKSISQHEFQTKKAKTRLIGLQEKLPNLDKQKQNINILEAECQKLLNEITEVESSLPSKKNVSALLTELVQLGADLKIASVRQKLDESKEYSSIYIELKFNAPYINTVNYLQKVESISPFLVIQELDITEENVKITRGGPEVRLILSGLLGDMPTAEMVRVQGGEPLAISRNIFVSKQKPILKARKIDLKIEGITYSSSNPTAIVNGEVVRVGSVINGFTVEGIHSESVVVSDDFGEYVVNVIR